MWTTPEPSRHRSGNAGNPARSIWWRLGHSLWLIVPIAGFSCLGGAAFVVIGLRARRPSWWIPGIVYVAIGLGGFVLVSATSETSAISDWAVGLMFVGWFTSALHAVVINPQWLRLQAANAAWYDQPHAAPGPFGGSPGPAGGGPAGWYGPAVPGLAPDPRAFYGSGPTAAPIPPAGPPPTIPPPTSPPPTSPPPTSPAGPLDVNTATADQLASLPGFGRARADHAVAARTALRGFGSVDEFTAAAGLAPHELVQVRRLLTCSVEAAGSVNSTGSTGSTSSTGDWTTPAPPTPGRILDV
jgi:hypothetical protein